MSEAPVAGQAEAIPTTPVDPALARTMALAQAAMQTAQQAQAAVIQAQAADPSKPWYKSKGVVGSIIAGSMASLAPAVLEASRADPKTQLITFSAMAVVGTLASMFGLVGRVTASQPVK